MSGQIGDGLQRSVEEAAECLGVSTNEVWRMINTGELTVQEAADGEWTIVAWSIEYLVSAREKKFKAEAEVQPTAEAGCRIPITPSPPRASAQDSISKREARRQKEAKKWKQKFDELGRKKNRLQKERRELLQDMNTAGTGRLPKLDRELREVEAERERHQDEGLERGFLQRDAMVGRRRSPGVVTEREKIGLAMIGLRPGLRFSSELEMFNPPDSPDQR